MGRGRARQGRAHHRRAVLGRDTRRSRRSCFTGSRRRWPHRLGRARRPDRDRPVRIGALAAHRRSDACGAPWLVGTTDPVPRMAAISHAMRRWPRAWSKVRCCGLHLPVVEPTLIRDEATVVRRTLSTLSSRVSRRGRNRPNARWVDEKTPEIVMVETR